MTYKTPGVYVEEIQLFPPSVVPVATAIPAFIGYTENHKDDNGDSLLLKPTRIKSLLEFREKFGGKFIPSSYAVFIDTAAGNSVKNIESRNNSNEARRYFMYACLRHYFDNGGGPCYIVSVGKFPSAIQVGDATSGLLGGIAKLKEVDEPTLILFPDAVGLVDGTGKADLANFASVQNAALIQSKNLQDRFAILDVMEGDKDRSVLLDPIDNFRNNVSSNPDEVKYGAAYYPWLQTTYKPTLQYRNFALFNNANPPVAVDPATLTTDPIINAFLTLLNLRTSDSTAVAGAVATAGFNASTFNLSALKTLWKQRKDAVVAAGDLATTRTAFGNLLLLIRQIALSFQVLDGSFPADSADLQAIVGKLKADATLKIAIADIIGFEKDPQVRAGIDTPANWGVAEVDTAYSALNGTAWISVATVSGIPVVAPPKAYAGANVQERTKSAINDPQLESLFNGLAAGWMSLFEAAEFLYGQAEKQLFANHPFFRDLTERVKREMSIIPPSGAVAGVYASTDRSRGVWKAPANVSLNAVVAPAVKINHQDQMDLNVTSTGKSVNAIRAFTGKGTMVWGARTLAGNDNEWRYVPVRRFYNFAEESIKKATEPFVFEPNDANTWIKVRAMIENFLTVLWRQGALQGATTNEAFYVKVGLGETMTPLDILEGRMIVEIGMAVVRPAEFIILKFSHKMQES